MTDNDDDDVQTYRVKRDGEPDLRFIGRKRAEVWSGGDHSRPNYSGSTGRWTELALYQVKNGKYICTSIGRTQWQGEHDRYTAIVCDTEAAVVEFFGHGWLAKRLYDAAGIDSAEEIA
jgi:hypothetical protein